MAPPWGLSAGEPLAGQGDGTLLGNAPMVGQEREATAKCFSSEGQKGGGCLS